jgi:GNAT superfamily N-acetyltransferase
MDEKRWVTLKDGRRIQIDTNKYMNDKIRKKKTPKINEQESNYGDYNYCALWMNDADGNPIAHLTYLKLNDMKKSDIYKGMFGGRRIAVERIDVDENYRRKGYATALLKKMQSKYPGEEIRFGQLEPDGEKLLKSIADITDSELKEGHKRLTYYGRIKK